MTKPPADVFRTSRLAAASFGLALGALIGLVVSLYVGANIATQRPNDPLVVGAGLGFWAAALMGPAALVTGIVAKVRQHRPGWWSTIGVLIGGITVIVVGFTLLLARALTP